MRRRWNRVAGVVALVATLGAGAAAFQIDPEILTQVATPPTGLWIPAATSGEIVHVDAASGDVTARVEVGAPGAELTLAERDQGVVVVDGAAGRVTLVDPALQEVVRAVDGVRADVATVDIGPESVVTASGTELALIDLEVTGSTLVTIAGAARSVVADGLGARVETGVSRFTITPDGSAEDEAETDGVFVRAGARVLVASPSGVRTTDGSEAACFVGTVDDPDHVVGGERWVVAIDGATVHVADLANGECVALKIADDETLLGRPVVARGRVFVPETGSGVVHIVEPFRRLSQAHPVLPAGDLRVRARGDFVVAYDTRTPIAAFLDRGGVVRFVDTSIDERGFAAVIDEDGSAAVVGDVGQGIGGTGGVGGGVSTSDGAPVIDASVLAANLQNPDDEGLLPDDELVANFAFSATTVAVGEEVRFVDTSTGSPESWLWDFGDGTGAEGPEVQKSWDEPGTYPVTLRVTKGDETSDISLAITVVPAEVALPPAADFAFSSSVVDVGQEVAFEDRSDGAIERWRWDFGDGTSATQPNVNKSWAQPGRYSVQLTVANDQGSDSAVVVIEVIEGLEAPVAVLTVDATDVDLGAPVSFRASSSTDPASYTWDFGDGRTSSGPEVVHVFLAEGVFTVTLTATNDAGVSRATTRIVVTPPTQAPVAAIGAIPSVIEVGDVVTLASLSTNSPDTESWTFGDGQSATGARVTHSWQRPGSFLVTLTATNVAGTDTVTRTVEVLAELPPPTAQIGDFDASPPVGETTVFLDASVDASSWLWDFGDGVTSSAPNPLHTFSTAGAKTVTLTVTNRNGSDSTSVVVEPRLVPTASFVVSSTAIRVGESVTFSDDSINAVSWSWNFGDGATSTAQNPVHTYSRTGTFGATLQVRSSTGDEATFGPLMITVDPPAPRLTRILRAPLDSATITTLTTTSFTAIVDPASGPIETFEIDFGDLSPPRQNTTGTFLHAYESSGTYVVTMRARGPLGDLNEVSRSFTVVDPAPPLIAIAPSVPTTAPAGTVTLTGVSQPGSGPIAVWRWEVRHGPDLWEYTGRVVDHRFEATGIHRITLIAESPVAAVPDATVSRNITITIPPAPTILSITANPSPATTGVLVAFTPIIAGSATGWEWDYEGSGYAAGGPIGQHIFNTPGPKLVRLRVTGPFGQQTEQSVALTVNPRPSPTAPVAVPGGVVTTGTNVALTSSDSGGLTGLRWDWRITSGATTISYVDAGPSINHLFGTAGSWTVTVTATDRLGITGSNVAFVTVQDPVPPLVAGFVSSPTATPLRVQFTDTSTGPPISSWRWDFGSPGAVGDASARNPQVTYPGPGTYSVTLTVTSGAASDDVTVLVTVS